MTAISDRFNLKEIELAISRASTAYNKLMLVVGKSGAGKTELLNYISQKMDIPFLNLGLDLSQKLMSLTVRQRKLKAIEMIGEILDDLDSARVVVDNTEIIFDPSLEISPLRFLQNLSRNRIVIWSWNGEVNGDFLIYAYPGHPEYQRLSAKELITISI